jgi:hypothetical protein
MYKISFSEAMKRRDVAYLKCTSIILVEELRCTYIHHVSTDVKWNRCRAFQMCFPSSWRAQGRESSWLRYHVTSRKVAGSIPDEVIGFLNLPNPSSSTMALGSTQLIREMSTRNFPDGKGWPAGA